MNSLYSGQHRLLTVKFYAKVEESFNKRTSLFWQIKDSKVLRQMPQRKKVTAFSPIKLTRQASLTQKLRQTPAANV
jgi:hypothetical protein